MSVTIEELTARAATRIGQYLGCTCHPTSDGRVIAWTSNLSEPIPLMVVDIVSALQITGASDESIDMVLKVSLPQEDI